MKFDFVIGNPPYQDNRQGDSTTALPVYHNFMDGAYSVSNRVELIHPARFLFDAGRTPKDWNQKMLNDEHFKIFHYEENADTIFPNTEIKGGVVISYRDATKHFGSIGTFTVYPQLNSLLQKVLPHTQDGSLTDLAFVASKFNIENLSNDYPIYKGHERRMSSNVLSFDCFHDDSSSDDLMIYGIYNKQRKARYISKKYVDTTDNNIMKYKVVMPKADGSGAFGNTITMPEILFPCVGFTHTFLGIGAFDKKSQAENVLKYIKTKFTRTLLSILKVTQDLNADKFKYVPLQNFTSESDIDWSVSIADIDKQLYKKYGFSQEEIDFVETNVKEMA
ncbi:MAG TPA: restriction endonuclease [Ruminococcaceae bacterium]|nr:restriction endonuclease [Oscillospiraceae bacterium]